MNCRNCGKPYPLYHEVEGGFCNKQCYEEWKKKKEEHKKKGKICKVCGVIVIYCKKHKGYHHRTLLHKGYRHHDLFAEECEENIVLPKNRIGREK